MTTTAEHRFVPAEFDPSDFANIEPLIAQLAACEPASADELHAWMLDLSELLAVVYEHGSRCNIDSSCHTEDEDIEKRYMHWLREISPKLQPSMFELQKKYLANPHHTELAERDGGYAVMNREWTADVELFREENVAVGTKCSELSKDYGKVQGAMTIDFEGETQTMQQVAKYLEETDRDLRERAWRAMSERRLRDTETCDTIFDELMTLRQSLAENAGHANYRDYKWVERYRFDYGPDDCHAFADAIEKVCMPVVRELEAERMAELGVDALRPWDGSVDPKGRPPLRPFDPDDIDGFVDTTCKAFNEVSPDFGEQLRSLQTHGDLDLASRRGKRPGGFQASLEASKRPFIFMNAAGTQRDVETLLHEGGHAFHYLASRDIPNLFVRHAPIEFCEVASMSMELLTVDALGLYFDEEAFAARAKRHQLEGVIKGLTWIATIDQFQHWLYTNVGHTRAERTAAWLEIYGRFTGDATDWTGLEDVRASLWQRQVHLYSYPFYYIEYGIAQLGALGVWRNYRADKDQSLADLRKAFTLGGTRPLPEIFETAGVPFRFDADTVAPLIEMLREDLVALPA